MSLRSAIGELLSGLKVSLLWCGLLILCFIGQLLAPGHLLGFALVPREPVGLMGVLTMPFLHGGPAHLLSNLSALVVVLAVLFSDERYEARSALTTIWLGSGVGTWLIGRGAPHVGASGVIFGIVAYLITSSLFIRSWRSVGFGLFVLAQYVAIFHSVTPTLPWISWEGHLAGTLMGIWTAFALLSEASPRAKWVGLAGSLTLLLAAWLTWVAFPEGQGPRAWVASLSRAVRELRSTEAGDEEPSVIVDEAHRFRLEMQEGWKRLEPPASDPTRILRIDVGQARVNVVVEPALEVFGDVAGGDEDSMRALAELSAPALQALESHGTVLLEYHGRPAVRGSWSGLMEDAAMHVSLLVYYQAEHLVTVSALSMVDRAAAEAGLDGFLEAHRPLDGAIRPPSAGADRVDAVVDCWRSAGDRVVDECLGLELHLPPEWEVLRRSELLLLDSNALLAVATPRRTQQVVFTAAAAAAQSPEARARAEARVFARPEDSRPWPVRLGERALELAVSPVEGGMVALGADWEARRGLFVTAVWLGDDDEEARGRVESLLAGARRLPPGQHERLLAERRRSRPFGARAGEGWSVLEGRYRHFASGVEWMQPGSDWRLLPAAGSSEAWPEATLVAQAPHRGLTVVLWVADRGGLDAEEVHEREVENTRWAFDGESVARVAGPERARLGQAEALATRITGALDAGLLVSAPHGDHRVAVLVFGERELLGQRSEDVLEVLDRFRLDRPRGARRHEPTTLIDERLGLRMDKPGPGCRFKRYGLDNAVTTTLQWDCGRTGLTVGVNAFDDELMMPRSDGAREMAERWLEKGEGSVEDVELLPMDWYFGGRKARCWSLDAQGADQISCELQRGGIRYLVGVHSVHGSRTKATDLLDLFEPID